MTAPSVPSPVGPDSLRARILADMDGSPLRSDDFKALGLPFEAFLRYAKVSPETRRMVHELALRRLEASSC